MSSTSQARKASPIRRSPICFFFLSCSDLTMHPLSKSSQSMRTSAFRNTSHRLWRTLVASEEALAYQTTAYTQRRLLQGNSSGRRGVVRRGRGIINNQNNSSRSHVSTPMTALRKQNRSRFSSQAVGAESSSMSATAAAASSRLESTLSSTQQQQAEEPTTYLSWQATKALFVASAVPLVTKRIAFNERVENEV